MENDSIDWKAFYAAQQGLSSPNEEKVENPYQEAYLKGFKEGRKDIAQQEIRNVKINYNQLFDAYKELNRLYEEALKRKCRAQIIEKAKSTADCANCSLVAESEVLRHNKSIEYAYANACENCRSNACTRDNIMHCKTAHDLYQAFLDGLESKNEG